MNSIILCEGSTDYFLLQYYMRKAHQWDDDKAAQSGILRLPGQKSRKLIRNTDTLTLMAVGGCSELGNGLKTVLQRNYLSRPDLSDIYEKIVIITDRDEVETEARFIQATQQMLDEFDVQRECALENNLWVSCSMCSQIGLSVKFSILLMVIPFEENGAMETFLLNAIKNDNSYDGKIIDECNLFVERVDPAKRYLKSRRYITKAKFDTYFSIRTPVQQYAERQTILKNVRWEQYTDIQKAFEKLNEL